MTASPPIDPSVLLALAERCEREESSAALNFAIWEAVHARRAPVGTFEEWVAPAYATSLDAAVTLVPEDAWREVNGPRKYLNIPSPVPAAWRAHIDTWQQGGYHVGWGKTPALALCAAALRARAAIAELEVPIGSRISI